MVIRRVGVWSVARVAAVLYAAIGVLGGLLFAGISLAGAGIAAAQQSGAQLPPWFGALFGVGAIIILPVLYGIMGLVLGAVTAAIYNVVAGAVGGIEMDIQ